MTPSNKLFWYPAHNCFFITLEHNKSFVKTCYKVSEFSCLFCLEFTLYLCYYTPTHRVGAILQSPCPFVRPSIHTFVTDISASTGRNDFIFDIWLWHGDLYRVSPFQVYRISTSCLPCDLQMNEWGYS